MKTRPDELSPPNASGAITTEDSYIFGSSFTARAAAIAKTRIERTIMSLRLRAARTKSVRVRGLREFIFTLFPLSHSSRLRISINLVENTEPQGPASN
jgi:hypothetical protein